MDMAETRSAGLSTVFRRVGCLLGFGVLIFEYEFEYEDEEENRNGKCVTNEICKLTNSMNKCYQDSEWNPYSITRSLMSMVLSLSSLLGSRSFSTMSLSLRFNTGANSLIN